MDETNTFGFSDDEIKLMDLFQTYIPKIISKIKNEKSKSLVEDEVIEEPSLNPTTINYNDKDIEVIDGLIRRKGFTFTSEVMMVHTLLSVPKLNQFDNEEMLVDYLTEVGGIELHKLSEILTNYNEVKDDFSNGRTIGEIPMEYVEGRQYGHRPYDGKGKKVYKWKGR